MLKCTLENMEILSRNATICNFVNGSRWEEIKKDFNDKIVIPYTLYYDDFQLDNPIGSHKTENPIAAFYFGFPTMPQFLLSLLENIIPTMLIKTKYINTQLTSVFTILLIFYLCWKAKESSLIINGSK